MRCLIVLIQDYTIFLGLSSVCSKKPPRAACGGAVRRAERDVGGEGDGGEGRAADVKPPALLSGRFPRGGGFVRRLCRPILSYQIVKPVAVFHNGLGEDELSAKMQIFL